MMRIEAPTLEEAYEKASIDLGCSVSDLKSEVIQHPSKGLLGFMKKSAIIIVVCDVDEEIEEDIDIKKPISGKEVPDSFIEEDYKEKRPDNNNFELSSKIEKELQELMEISCFNIDVVEVDVVDNTALIFIDGEDAALLIGKEGYRYNALSYMLFNWLFSNHNLYIKLEIAEFLTTQQEMIRSYIAPVIERVNINGKGKTRPLDGILVQIALEQLREAFPNKYVAVKTARDGRRFILINDFNSRKDG